MQARVRLEYEADSPDGIHLITYVKYLSRENTILQITLNYVEFTKISRVTNSKHTIIIEHAVLEAGERF